MMIHPGLSGTVVHPPGTRYLILTIPPCTPEEAEAVRAAVSSALAGIQPELMVQVMTEMAQVS